jgi:MFS family permease
VVPTSPEKEGPGETPVSDRDRTVIYLAVLMALFLAALDQTIVATALPRMVEDLGGIDRYAWVATSYLLASTALALVYGKLADTYPRKFVTLGAVGLFLVGSILCGCRASWEPFRFSATECPSWCCSVASRALAEEDSSR